ncbi:hypothetical protein [Roseiterribacter gracilis]|uniref:Uncharacterized protein n=1 Tax=Roseiterribacter gracilis TaxID=2812848 RepID=A0A8S8X6N3_9PROT|nr:hypothetical protein TMPK1_07500 [Rhodospirillales bacterium TMPK1]
MRTALLALSALLLLTAPAVADDIDSNLIRAVFADGRLWVLSDRGTLASLAEGETRWRSEPQPEQTLELCAQDGHPVAIGGIRAGTKWTVRRHSSGSWQELGTIEHAGMPLIAATCGAKEILLLTQQNLTTITDGTAKTRGLYEPMPNTIGNAAATLVTPELLLVGMNAGEWGGGLYAIERDNGFVSSVSHTGLGICGGVLNPKCHPVNGIVASPWKKGCVIAAIGLVHMGSDGSLVEVCANDVRSLFAKQLGPDPRPPERRNGVPFPSVAFFGLVSGQGRVWAAGIDGVYEVRANGVTQLAKLPKFQSIGGVGISFDQPGLVLVLTSANRRFSVRRDVPMLVAR